MMNINEDDDNGLDMGDYCSAYDTMDGEGAVDYTQYGNLSNTSNQPHEHHCL